MIGFEAVNSPFPLRITPVDQAIEVPVALASFIVMALAALDRGDPQPGDGEWDISVADFDNLLSKVPSELRGKLGLNGLLEKFKSMDSNLVLFVDVEVE